MSIDKKQKPCTEVEKKLAMARACASDSDYTSAEKHYIDAIKQAKSDFGPASGDYGLVLLEVADFLEESNNSHKLKTIRNEVRRILSKYAASLKITDGQNGVKAP